MATVSLRKVNRVFDDHHAVCDLDLDVGDGEFIALVGPSGCGKTTALRMIAGLEQVTSGEIVIDDQLVNNIEPQRRDVAMVFQEYALYPQMTVFDNIAFALKLRRTPRREIEARVREVAEILSIQRLLARKPRALSGGQRQRVAMGRALVRDPKVFLMDEPLSNLDAKLRVQMRYEVARIQRELGTTTIYVTHDQTEAMTMGSRVAVMHEGRLLQVDTPQRLYDRPANTFVAAFIGTPEMNLLHASVERRDGELVCRIGPQELVLPPDVARRLPEPDRGARREVILGLRPEALEDGALLGMDAASASLHGEVQAAEVLGAERLVHVRLPGARVVANDVTGTIPPGDEEEPGATAADAQRTREMIVGRFHPASRAAAGDAIKVVVDMRMAHLFDPTSGRPFEAASAPRGLASRQP
jgi:multiple sugar transport system ATP-binding protein